MRSMAQKIVGIAPYRAAKFFLAFRQSVENYRTAMGARGLLEHVTENRWLECFEAGDTPEEAVQRELLLVAD